MLLIDGSIDRSTAHFNPSPEDPVGQGPSVRLLEPDARIRNTSTLELNPTRQD